MTVLDAHQHLYPEAVLRVLERRRTAPFARWRNGAFTVTLAGEEPFTVDATVHDPAYRLDRMRQAGVEQAIVALSCAVGVEALPSADAAPILDAWAGSSEPPKPYTSGTWGPSAAIALIERNGRTWYEDDAT